ncbi:uncharacterized protein EHS24_002239 [Apiotrichum porosum]|uniref:BRCT domain-containing protein n=1 Tax=Apiotrichum porosum TaxID=105984 RepID=A0A427XID9_9TREE|nr:uncharacterized protein EHS24_002239 [Apiotrichum porosum]RSH78514.1 hypothetical protein EHS24_002239 [Apiotrichum porosum]
MRNIQGFAPASGLFSTTVAYLSPYHWQFKLLSQIIENGGGKVATLFEDSAINVFLTDYPPMWVEASTRERLELEYYRLVKKYGLLGYDLVVCVTTTWVFETAANGYMWPGLMGRYGLHRLYNTQLPNSSYLFGTTRRSYIEQQRELQRQQLEALNHVARVDATTWGLPHLSEDEEEDAKSEGSRNTELNEETQPEADSERAPKVKKRVCSARPSSSVRGLSSRRGGGSRSAVRFAPYSKDLPKEARHAPVKRVALARKRAVSARALGRLGPSPTQLNTQHDEGGDEAGDQTGGDTDTEDSPAPVDLPFPPLSQKRFPRPRSVSSSDSEGSGASRAVSANSVTGGVTTAARTALGPFGTVLDLAEALPSAAELSPPVPAPSSGRGLGPCGSELGPAAAPAQPVPAAAAEGEVAPHGVGRFGTWLDTPPPAPQLAGSSSRTVLPAASSTKSLRPVPRGDEGLGLGRPPIARMATSPSAHSSKSAHPSSSSSSVGSVVPDSQPDM